MRPSLWHMDVGERAGGAPVLLLPGALQCAREWPRSLVDALSDDGFRVLMVDHRDSGRNVWTRGEYDLSDMAGDVHHFLLSKRVKELHLVGASMGGAIAQLMALDSRVKLRSLTLISTTSGRGLWDPGLAPPSKRVVESMRRQLELQEGRGGIQAALAHRYREAAGREAVPAREAGARARRAVLHGYHPLARHGDAFQSTPPRTGRLSKISTPTLIVHGSDDEVFPPSHAHLMHECIPHAALCMIDGMGHYISEKNGGIIGAKIAAHAHCNEHAD